MLCPYCNAFRPATTEPCPQCKAPSPLVMNMGGGYQGPPAPATWGGPVNPPAPGSGWNNQAPPAPFQREAYDNTPWGQGMVPQGALSYRSEHHTSELQSPDHLVCPL